MKKRFIKIGFADTNNDDWVRRLVTDSLTKLGYDYAVDDDPEYLFCSNSYTNEHLEYDCIKINFCGENQYMDLNLYDYMIGTIDFRFEDRFLRYPFYLWRDGTKDAFLAACNRERTTKINERFCCMVVSNGTDADKYREELFWALSKYKVVDSAGEFLNNVGFKLKKGIAPKMEFCSNYKFIMACENGSQKGYTTEKIIEAWNSGGIPIYWGNPDIGIEFNSKAFVNCHDYSDISEVVNRVIELDRNNDLYLEMLNQPIVNGKSSASEYLREDYLESYLDYIISKPYCEAKKLSNTSRYSMNHYNNREKAKESYYWRIYRELLQLWDVNRGKGVYSNYDVYIYGAGAMGRTVAKMIIEGGGSVKAFIDRNGTEFTSNDDIDVLVLDDSIRNRFEADSTIINSVYDPIGRIKRDLESRLMVNVISLSEFIEIC